MTSPLRNRDSQQDDPLFATTSSPLRWIHLHHVILPLAALIAVLPLILNDCFCGHDFSFHLLNWMEAARQFTHGNLHPHWAFSPAYNAGEPRFVFYPPLSWTIGAILGLIMPWSWTPIAYTWLALTAAGLTLYRLAREFSTQNAALIAAAFYLINPYTLFTAYERTAYAELLAAAWIPLLLLGILRKRVTIPGIAIPVALLWLTNDPAAIMGCYALGLLTLIRIFIPDLNPNAQSNPPQPTSRLQLAATSVAGAVLGLGLASFYLVPATYERRYIQIAAIFDAGTHVENHFLFHHTANPVHNAIINTASFIAVVLLLLTAAAIAIAAHHSSPPSPKEREARPPTTLLFLLATFTIVITFLLTSISNPIWQHLPELLFLQFPWRLLTILAAILGLAISLALASFKIENIPAVAFSLTLTAILAISGFNLFRQYCPPDKTATGILARFHANSGTAPSEEYTPIAANNQSLSHINPPYWLIPNHLAPVNTNAPANSTAGPSPTSLTLNSPQPQILVLNLRNYPNWRITLNQTTLTTRLHRSDGLIALTIPAGLNHITVTYDHTFDQIIGNALTILSLALLLLVLRHKPQHSLVIYHQASMNFTVQSLLHSGVELTDSALERLLPSPDTLPHSIHRAMRHSTFAGGKRLRPILCMEAARMVSGEPDIPEGAADLGAAIEMLHTYSLIHDDLPALDNDDLRRGQPTCHVVFGEAIAILAGDALQTLAFQTLASLPSPPATTVAILSEIALAIGTGVGANSSLPPGMIGGQVVDIESEGKTPTAELVESIHRAKTGALITVSIVAGGLYGSQTKPSSDTITRLRTFGEKAGLAFQIVDDVLDMTQNSAQLGKTAGKDTASVKATWPAVYGIERSLHDANELIADAFAALAPFGPAAKPLKALANYLVERKH